MKKIKNIIVSTAITGVSVLLASICYAQDVCSTGAATSSAIRPFHGKISEPAKARRPNH